MWKIRNDIKHGGKQKHRWNEAQITQIITELQKKTDKREKRTVTEIMKWRKKKIDKWVMNRRQAIEEAKIKQEEMKIAMRNFGTQYKIFTVEPAEKGTEAQQDKVETDKRKKIKETEKEPGDRRHRKLKQTTITMMMTRRDEPSAGSKEVRKEETDKKEIADVETEPSTSQTPHITEDEQQTGKETQPAETEREEHITADMGESEEELMPGTALLAEAFGGAFKRKYTARKRKRKEYIEDEGKNKRKRKKEKETREMRKRKNTNNHDDMNKRPKHRQEGEVTENTNRTTTRNETEHVGNIKKGIG